MKRLPLAEKVQRLTPTSKALAWNAASESRAMAYRLRMQEPYHLSKDECVVVWDMFMMAFFNVIWESFGWSWFNILNWPVRYKVPWGSLPTVEAKRMAILGANFLGAQFFQILRLNCAPPLLKCQGTLTDPTSPRCLKGYSRHPICYVIRLHHTWGTETKWFRWSGV